MWYTEIKFSKSKVILLSENDLQKFLYSKTFHHNCTNKKQQIKMRVILQIVQYIKNKINKYNFQRMMERKEIWEMLSIKKTA